MGEHETWFHLLPGYANLREYLSFMQREQQFFIFQKTHFGIAHVVISLFVVLLLTFAALRYAAKLRQAKGDDRVIPEQRFGIRNLFELLIEGTLGIAEGVMGRKNAERFLPLIGTFVIFILFNNLIGLVPGFLSPTDTLKTNLALSGFVLVVTHLLGVIEHGPHYFARFLGPVWWLAWLIGPIEIVSHFLIRPASLAIRLMGNMFADHKLLATISLLAPLLVPLPFYVLGTVVCMVQALVFSLLTMIYIGEAVAQAH